MQNEYVHNLGYAFYRMVDNRPDQPALIYPSGVSITYAALNERSNKIARALLERKIVHHSAVCIFKKKTVDSIAIALPSASLDCRNGQMTGHMKKALKVTEFDSITFAVRDYALATADSGLAVTLDGSLTLGGVTKDISVAALAKAGPDGMLQVTGRHELNMKDYDLKPPTLMFGRIKVHDKVTVNFDLLLKN